jgi:hypothetical protein
MNRKPSVRGELSENADSVMTSTDAAILIQDSEEQLEKTEIILILLSARKVKALRETHQLNTARILTEAGNEIEIKVSRIFEESPTATFLIARFGQHTAPGD